MSSLDLIQLPYCHESDRYDPKFVIALIAAVATGVFFCRPKITNISFYNEEEPVAETESHLEPITSREQYLQDALQMAKQHRALLEEEVQMLDRWVEHFQQHPSPYDTYVIDPDHEDTEDIDNSILAVLHNAENGITAKEIVTVLNNEYQFEDSDGNPIKITKTDVNSRLYSMKNEGIVNFSSENKKAPVWRI